MMKLRLIVPIGLCLVLNSCKAPDAGISGVHQLDLVSLQDKPVSFGLGEIARHIEYIALETKPDVLIGSMKYCVGKDWIYVLSSKDQKVYLFDRQGKFVRTIGALGKGPGEYPGAQEILISPDGNLIFLYSTRTSSCFVYTINGELHSHFDLAYYAWRFAPLGSGKHLMIAPYGDFTFTGEGQFLYFIQDSTGTVVRKYPSDHIIRMMGNFGIGQFYINPLSVLSYVEFSDTVFQVDISGEMNPRYALNFGKFRIPNEAQNDVSVLQQNRYQYITEVKLVEAGPGLFIRYLLHNEFRTGFYPYNHSPVQSIQNTKGLLINDLDGGPDFFPAASDGNKEVYALIQPVDLLIRKKDGEFENKKFAKGDAHRTFAEFINLVKEDDNPIIMVVTLK